MADNTDFTPELTLTPDMGAAAAAEAALAGAGGMEGVLGTVADGLTDQQRQDYNPLEAYQSLMEWLG